MEALRFKRLMKSIVKHCLVTLSIFGERKSFIVLYFCLTANNTWSQSQATFDPPQTPLEIKAHRTIDNIRVDGVVEEKSWTSISPITEFIQYEPTQGKPASLKTEVRIVFDDENLYLSAICFDSLGKKSIRVPTMQRDFDFLQMEEVSRTISSAIAKI